MGRLRALRAYGGAVLALGLTVAALTAGVVVVAGVAEAGGGRAGLALPLLVLALVAVPVPALDLARRRRDEVTLARLRGAHGGDWVGVAAGQPATTALGGGALGAGLGMLALAALPAGWGAEPALGADQVRWAATVGLASVVIAGGCGLVAGREPMVAALRHPGWRPATGIAAVAAGVALTVAALGAAYLGLTGEGDAGPLVLAGAGLVAVASGVAVAAALRAARTSAAPALAGRPVGVLLGLRAALASASTLRTAAVVAAAVLAASALSGAAAARDWAEVESTVRAGAPLRFELPDDHALGALLLTERLDPDGRWLMAAAVDESVADEAGAAARRVAWLDLSRYAAVMSDHLAGTPGELGDVAPLRDAAAVEVVSGRTFELVAAAAEPEPGPAAAAIALRYLDEEGAIAEVVARLDPGAGSVTTTLRARGCTESCVVLELTASAPVTVESLRLGEHDLVADGWATDDGERLAAPLRVPADEPVFPLAARAPVPMLVAGDPGWAETGPAVQAVGGDTRPVQEVGEHEALPLVVGGGLVGDLGVGLAGAGASVPALRVLVLARPGLPADLRSALEEAGAEGPDVTVGGWSQELSDGTLADTRSRLVVGVVAAVAALLALSSGSGRRLRSAREQRAALRLAGVPVPALRRAAATATAAVAVLVCLATGLGGWLAVVATVDGTAPVPSGPNRLPFDTAVSPVLLGVAGTAAVAVLVAGLVGSLRARRHSAPAVLLAADPRWPA